MFRLLDSLRKGEHAGKKHSAQGWLKQKIEDNLQHDVQVCSKLPVKKIAQLGHYNEFTAVLEDNKTLSFFNLSTLQKIWSTAMVIELGHVCTDLKVSKSGLVLSIKISICSRISSWAADIQVFQNGNMLDRFASPAYPRVNLINDRIFFVHSQMIGVTINERTLTSETIHIQTIKGSIPFTAANENYYVVCVVEKNRESDILSAFVFDLQKNQHQIFKLFDATQGDITIDEINISNHDLVVGYRIKIHLPKSELMVFNLTNGNLLKKYNVPVLQYVWIQNLVVNDHYIAFRGETKDPYNPSMLYSINRETHAIQALTNIPDSIDQTPSLSLTDNLLVACCPSGCYRADSNSATTERYVINLHTNEVKQQTRYLRGPNNSSYFTHGLFVHPTTRLYVENFCTLQPNDKTSREIRLGAS